MIGEILAVLSVLSFVSSNVMFRRIASSVSPSQVNFTRTLIGTITYFVIALILGIFSEIFILPILLWVWLALSFITGQVIGDTTFFKAQEILGTTIALAISMTFPIITTIISLLLGEVFAPTFYISLALTVSGIITLGIGKRIQTKKSKKRKEKKDEKLKKDTKEQLELEKNDKLSLKKITNENISNNLSENQDKTATQKKSNKKQKDKNNSPKRAEEIEKHTPIKFFKKIILPTSKWYIILGISFAFIAAISWAMGIVLTEYAFTEVKNYITNESNSSLLGNVVRFPIAGLMLGMMSIPDRKEKVKNWSWKIWMWLIIGSLIGTSLGAYLYTEATQVAGAATVSMIASTSPLISIPLSWIINKEKVNVIEIIGICLTVSGVVLIFVF